MQPAAEPVNGHSAGSVGIDVPDRALFSANFRGRGTARGACTSDWEACRPPHAVADSLQCSVQAGSAGPCARRRSGIASFKHAAALYPPGPARFGCANSHCCKPLWPTAETCTESGRFFNSNEAFTRHEASAGAVAVAFCARADRRRRGTTSRIRDQAKRRRRGACACRSRVNKKAPLDAGPFVLRAEAAPVRPA